MPISEIDLGKVVGPPGPKGDPGERGPEGPTGPQGENGIVNADTAITFTQAAERKNIVTGEKFGTILGKVAKFFADLKTVAFTGSYNDLSDKPTSLPANGGNANTVGGKSAETLQNYNNLTNKPNLGTAASQGVANNFTTNTAGYVADARAVKQLNDNLSAKFDSLNSALSGKIVSNSGNIKFSGGEGGKSYGYINIPSDCKMLAVYMQEVSGNVGLMVKGFNQNAGAGGYTVWLDFTINDNVFMHWIYVKV